MWLDCLYSKLQFISSQVRLVKNSIFILCLWLDLFSLDCKLSVFHYSEILKSWEQKFHHLLKWVCSKILVLFIALLHHSLITSFIQSVIHILLFIRACVIPGLLSSYCGRRPCIIQLSIILFLEPFLYKRANDTEHVFLR